MRQRIKRSVYRHDVALVGLVGGLCCSWAGREYCWCRCADRCAGAAGVWLFYVQHQFEDVYWERRGDWSYADAALQRQPYLKLPKVLQFFTGNIGLHHVHHLSAASRSTTSSEPTRESGVSRRAHAVPVGWAARHAAKALGRGTRTARSRSPGHAHRDRPRSPAPRRSSPERAELHQRRLVRLQRRKSDTQSSSVEFHLTLLDPLRAGQRRLTGSGQAVDGQRRPVRRAKSLDCQVDHLRARP